jgi:glycine/D-amino acid oxidase-like deaminating enzyme
LWQTTAPPAPRVGTLCEEISADVVVIGSGYTGLSSALHLNQLGASVAVLEAADIGFGGAGRNVGLVNAGLWITPQAVVATLGSHHGERLLEVLGAAPRLVFELIATHAIECEATRAGTLHCAVGTNGVAQLEERASQWLARGAPVRLLSAAETAARTGSPTFAGALFDARAGTIQPLAYVRGLARAAMSGGTRIFIGSPALSAQRDGNAWRVGTHSGCVRAKWIIVATDAYSEGPWSVVRAEQVRMPYFNFATAPLDAATLASILPGREGAWDTRLVLSSFRLDAAGRLVFGSIGALSGAAAPIHEGWARRALRRIFPQLRNVVFETSWFGQIGMTDDNVPRLHVFAPNVVGFSGYNGRGIGPGTAFGRLLAGFVSGKLDEADMPLPISEPTVPAMRPLKEAFYEFGSGAAHLLGARI